MGSDRWQAEGRQRGGAFSQRDEEAPGLREISRRPSEGVPAVIFRCPMPPAHVFDFTAITSRLLVNTIAGPLKNKDGAWSG